MRVRREYWINPDTGHCSDGTNLWDWDEDRLQEVIDYCWYKDIVDLVNEILEFRKKKANG